MLKTLILATVLQLAPYTLFAIELMVNEIGNNASMVKVEADPETVNTIKCFQRSGGFLTAETNPQLVINDAIISNREEQINSNLQHPEDLKAGFEFIITNGKGIVIDTLKTCEEGKASSIHLQHGIYYVIQSKAPEGYELDGKAYKITIDDSVDSSSIKSASRP